MINGVDKIVCPLYGTVTVCFFFIQGQGINRSDNSYKPSFLTDQELKHLVLEASVSWRSWSHTFIVNCQKCLYIFAIFNLVVCDLKSKFLMHLWISSWTDFVMSYEWTCHNCRQLMAFFSSYNVTQAELYMYRIQSHQFWTKLRYFYWLHSKCLLFEYCDCANWNWLFRFIRNCAIIFWKWTCSWEGWCRCAVMQ
jgi:hypothetical protein